VVTVNAYAGPLTVTSQSSAVTYSGGSSQPITWNVAGTTANNINAANVDILWSTDNGNSWTTLLAGTPNDGSQNVTIPNSATSTGRIMVKGSNHIFFNVNKANITVTAGTSDTQAPTAPTLAASGTTQNSTNLSWSGATDNVGVTGYEIYRGSTLLGNTSATNYTATGLAASTTYTFTVKAMDAAGNTSAASNSVSVTTLAPASDTTAPTAPTLSASGTTSSATNLSWSGATDNVGVTGYDVYQNSALIGSTASTSYSVTGLTTSTNYSFTVKAKDAAGNISAASNAVSVTTLSNSVTYCTASASNTADERIGNVKFGTINNSSTGTAGYENFTNISTNVTRGTSYQITITPTWTSTKYKESYAVYIDYNGNGVFTDSGEKVWTKTASTTTPVTGNITIPTTAKVGTTRMRVMMQYNTVPSAPCGTFTYGQVEDYTLNIVSANRDEDRMVTSTTGLSIYPNPIKGNILNIENAESSDFRIFDMSGKLISSGTVTDQKVDVNRLVKGVYIIQIGKTSKRFIRE
jgi:chitodextrinase